MATTMVQEMNEVVSKYTKDLLELLKDLKLISFEAVIPQEYTKDVLEKYLGKDNNMDVSISVSSDSEVLISFYYKNRQVDYKNTPYIIPEHRPTLDQLLKECINQDTSRPDVCKLYNL